MIGGNMHDQQTRPPFKLFRYVLAIGAAGVCAAIMWNTGVSLSLHTPTFLSAVGGFALGTVLDMLVTRWRDRKASDRQQPRDK